MGSTLSEVRVLCIETDGESAKETARRLENRRALIETATTEPSEATEALDNQRFDCVVGDDVTASMNGYELLDICERHGVPFILFTEEVDGVVDALSEGATEYVRKDASGETQYAALANSVEKAVRMNRAERRLQKDRSDPGDELIFTERTLNTLDEVFYVVDTDGSLLRWNEKLSNLTGYTHDEIADMDAVDFFPRDEREKIWDAMQRAVEEDFVTVESSVLTKGGDRIPHEITGTRLTDEGGKLVGLTGVGRDISHRKEREQELKESRRRLRAVLDGVDAAIWIRDKESRFLLINQAFRDLFEIDDETKVVGKRPEDFLPEEVASQFRENDIKTIDNEETTEIEEEVQTPHGVRTYLTRITPLFNDDGELYGTCGIASDITDLKEYEKRLQNQKERLDEFASVVSHDLRNPLSIFQGYLERAEETGDPEDFEKCRDAIARMDALIDDLLSLARNTDGTADTEPVNLDEVAKMSWQNTETREANLRVKTEMTVVADKGQLRQLFENLFRNSVEHGSKNPDSETRWDSVEHGSTGSHASPDDSAEHGSTTPDSGTRRDSVEPDSAECQVPSKDAVECVSDVTVTVKSLPDGFSIEDDGVGIPEEERDRVFESGYSEDNDGTGLGLYIVEQVAEAHGWDVTVTEGEEGGAAFEITGVELTDRRNADV